MPSVSSIVVNPTFGDGPRTIESHIFDFAGDLYGQSVKLCWVERIRDERKFSSVELLVEQIQDDALRARNILSAPDALKSSGVA